MKKFLIKIFLFTLPLILFSCPLDLILSNCLKKSNHASGEFSTWNAILDGKLNSDIFIYGSSRAWRHFNSQTIEDTLKMPTYNLGMDGHKFEMQHLRHILALKNNRKPKIIIHSVDVETLIKGNLFNEKQFLPYMLNNEIFYEYMSKYKGFSYIDYKLPLIRYMGKYKSLYYISKIALNLDNPMERKKGYQGKVENWNNDLENAKKKLKKYKVIPDSLTLNLFNRYLEDCHNQNIKVVLVYSPYYIDGQKFIANQSEIINLYKSLANKYNFDFIDYTKDKICYNKDYFYNASHLNKTGAELFSKKFAHDLKTLLKKEGFLYFSNDR